MYHSSVLGGVAAKLLRLPTIWCVRQADLDDRIPRSTRAIARLAGVMSARLPDRIVYNSALGRETHRAAGHDDSRALVIPNGFDVDMFRPDADARRTVRRELGLSTDTLLVGLIARFDPQKDHVTFVAAARRIHAAHPGARFILAGRGVDVRNKELGAMLDVAGVSAVTHCLGHTDAVPRLTAALDVACLSSRGEGFPSTVGEAMACAVPVVATAVGDVPSLVGATGYVVPPRDPPALAAAVIGLLDAPPEERTVLGAAGRARVAEKFSLAAMVGAYEDLWREVATARRPLAPARPR
jgi:glycosyltransferase involved in cell wall biosynthesis